MTTWRGLAHGTAIAGVLAAPLAMHAVLAFGGGVPAWAAFAMPALQVGLLTWIVTGVAGVAGFAGRGRGLLAATAACLFLLAAHAAPRTGATIAAALTHGLIYLGVGLRFGLSLRPGREALVSRMARRVEPQPTQALLAYTRGVTWLWACFSAAQLALSALLLAFAPLAIWSVFVNVLDAPLIVLTFALEYAVRRWRFRGARLASLAQTVRAFRRGPAAPSPVAS